MTRATAYPDQVTTLEQAVCATTYSGAQCLGFEWPENLGSIEEGKLADTIVLNHNLFEIAVTDIHQTELQKTIFEGDLVCEKERLCAH